MKAVLKLEWWIRLCTPEAVPKEKRFRLAGCFVSESVPVQKGDGGIWRDEDPQTATQVLRPAQPP